jgi:hypothetical protein
MDRHRTAQTGNIRRALFDCPPKCNRKGPKGASVDAVLGVGFAAAARTEATDTSPLFNACTSEQARQILGAGRVGVMTKNIRLGHRGEEVAERLPAERLNERCLPYVEGAEQMAVADREHDLVTGIFQRKRADRLAPIRRPCEKSVGPQTRDTYRIDLATGEVINRNETERRNELQGLLLPEQAKTVDASATQPIVRRPMPGDGDLPVPTTGELHAPAVAPLAHGARPDPLPQLVGDDYAGHEGAGRLEAPRAEGIVGHARAQMDDVDGGASTEKEQQARARTIERAIDLVVRALLTGDERGDTVNAREERVVGRERTATYRGDVTSRWLSLPPGAERAGDDVEPEKREPRYRRATLEGVPLPPGPRASHLEEEVAGAAQIKNEIIRRTTDRVRLVLAGGELGAPRRTEDDVAPDDRNRETVRRVVERVAHMLSGERALRKDGGGMPTESLSAAVASGMAERVARALLKDASAWDGIMAARRGALDDRPVYEGAEAVARREQGDAGHLLLPGGTAGGQVLDQMPARHRVMDGIAERLAPRMSSLGRKRREELALHQRGHVRQRASDAEIAELMERWGAPEAPSRGPARRRAPARQPHARARPYRRGAQEAPVPLVGQV